jgi:PAS domain S-box-containing protein
MEDKNLFSQLLDRTTAVVYVKDRSGRFLYVNRRFERLFHVRRSRVIGKTDHDLFPAAAANAFRRADRRVLSTGRVLRIEETAPHPDGSPRVYISIKAPIRDAAGRVRAVAGISTDITAEKKYRAALKSSESLLRLFAESAPGSSVFLLDARGRIATWNNANQRMRGFGKRDVLGRPYSCLFLPEDVRRGKPNKLLRTAEKTGWCRDKGWRARKGGSRFWGSFALSALRDDENRLKGFAVSAQDTSAARRTAESLRLSRRILSAEEAERKRIAHELHDGPAQKLSAAVFSLRAVIRECRSAKVGKEGRKTVRLLAETADELRAIARNLRPTALDDFGLAHALRDLCLQFRRAFTSCRARIGKVPRNLPPEVDMGVYRIAQEAMHNAVKHAEAAHVTLSFRRKKNRLELIIADDGIGLFRRPPRGRQGIGLIGIRERAAFLGGSADIRSARGGGTRIRVELPLKPPPLPGGGA